MSFAAKVEKTLYQMRLDTVPQSSTSAVFSIGVKYPAANLPAVAIIFYIAIFGDK